jgi:hypothetical protein
MSDQGGFDLVGPWADAAHRIAGCMTKGVDPRDLSLPEGEFSAEGVERYAREYCAAAGNASLGVVYAVASVGVCTATQGAWVTLCPLHGGGYLEIPTIQHAMAVADSGVGKSTILDAARRPLARALARGVDWRTERIGVMRAQAERWAREHAPEEQGLGAPRFDPKPFAAVYNAGICPITVVKDPTMEALGQILVSNGGVGTVASAEAEIFRAMSAYNSDGGSLSLLLDQWSQENISTIRVTRGVTEMDAVALNLIVLFQSDVFADVTGGMSGRGGDSFIQRGVFGRAHVIRATHMGGYERLARFYGEEEDLDFLGDGMTLPDGSKTPLGWALHDYEGALESLVEESNNYRLSKAIHRQWRLGLIEHGVDYQVREPEPPARHELRLDRAARQAYRRVQRLRLKVESDLADDRVDDDVRAVFVPLAARLTQHIMREAATISLGSGRRVISARAIEDAATRIIPWRVALTADALLTRQASVTETLMAQAAVSNPNNIDTSARGIVGKHLAMLATSKPGQRAEGFTKGEIRERVKQPLTRQRGSGVGIAGIVQGALDALVADPHSGVTLVADQTRVDAVGNPVQRYIVADDAIARLGR